MHDNHRRSNLKRALTYTTMFALGGAHFSLKANAMGVTELTSALRAMENDACNTAARNLEISHSADTALSLHLRNAGLNLSNAVALAQAMKKYSMVSGAALVSFSVSYNPELGDAGVEVLAKSLPNTVQEIGFVDCNFQDKGGEAILDWADQAPNLKMICIEGNRLTKETLSLFNDFRQRKPKVSVYL